jgi:erythronate-4-phosphate dehydrogenase
MIRIIADDKIPFLKGILEPYADVTYLPGKQITRDTAINADALLIRTRTKCTDDLLNGTQVSFIGTATIGFDHIDTQYCERHNIKWANAPGCNSSSVQQYIAGALLKMAFEFRFNLKDKTIGIIGVGNVGSKVEKLAGLLGMNVLLNDPPRARQEGEKSFVDLGIILHESDIVTVHVPLNVDGEDCTHHLFNEKSFKKLKKGAWFFNTSRGEVNDTPTLKQALFSGKLGGTVLDVWENEPDIDLELIAKAFIATPHIAGYSADGKANGAAIIVNSLCKYFDLPLKNWYPENLPQPPVPEIIIDAKGKSDDDIIREAVFQTYNITGDDIKFRFSPSDFEKQRGDYPPRREFPSFRIRLKGETEKVQKILEGLGFKIVSSTPILPEVLLR